MKGIFLKEQTLTDRQRKNLFILEAIRQGAPISRSDISQRTDINSLTIASYLKKFIQKGIVYEKGLDVSVGGRCPMLLGLNSDAGYVLSVGLNMYNIIGLMTNLSLDIVCEVKRMRVSLENDKMCVDEMMEVVEEVMEKSKVDKGKIRGIGVGVPGVVDAKEYTIRWPTVLGQKDLMVSVSLAEEFKNKFKLPVIVENDASSAVFAEKVLGQRQDVENMLYMFSEVGCGIVINGEIYRGTTGCAGEMGIARHDREDPDEGETCGFGRGTMEIGLLDEVKKISAEQVKGKFALMLRKAPNNIKLSDIYAAAMEEGNESVADIVRKAGEKFGKKIAFLANFLNPEIIVIGGGLEVDGGLMMGSIRKAVHEWTMNEVSKTINIVPSQFGENASGLGVACAVVQNVFMRS